MGVPVLIGVCQQASGGGSASSFSITSFGTVSVSFGTNSLNQTPIPVEQQVSALLNTGNSFTFPADSLKAFYDEETAGIPVQYSFTPIIDGSNIQASDLPTDGSCSVGYTFTFDPSRFPIKVYDLPNGEVLTSSPQQVVFTGLNRSVFTGADATLPSVLTDEATRSLVAPEPGTSADPALSVQIDILKGDGSFITQTQTIVVGETSIGPFIVGG